MAYLQDNAAHGVYVARLGDNRLEIEHVTNKRWKKFRRPVSHTAANGGGPVARAFMFRFYGEHAESCEARFLIFVNEHIVARQITVDYFLAMHCLFQFLQAVT